MTMCVICGELPRCIRLWSERENTCPLCKLRFKQIIGASVDPGTGSVVRVLLDVPERNQQPVTRSDFNATNFPADLWHIVRPPARRIIPPPVNWNVMQPAPSQPLTGVGRQQRQPRVVRRSLRNRRSYRGTGRPRLRRLRNVRAGNADVIDVDDDEEEEEEETSS